MFHVYRWIIGPLHIWGRVLPTTRSHSSMPLSALHATPVFSIAVEACSIARQVSSLLGVCKAAFMGLKPALAVLSGSLPLLDVPSQQWPGLFRVCTIVMEAGCRVCWRWWGDAWRRQWGRRRGGVIVCKCNASQDFACISKPKV